MSMKRKLTQMLGLMQFLMFKNVGNSLSLIRTTKVTLVCSLIHKYGWLKKIYIKNILNKWM